MQNLTRRSSRLLFCYASQRQDLGQIIYFGIDSLDTVVQALIMELRDSGKIVHMYGTLFSNVPDYNGSQVQVERIEVEG